MKWKDNKSHEKMFVLLKEGRLIVAGIVAQQVNPSPAIARIPLGLSACFGCSTSDSPLCLWPDIIVEDWLKALDPCM